MIKLNELKDWWTYQCNNYYKTVSASVRFEGYTASKNSIVNVDIPFKIKTRYVKDNEQWIILGNRAKYADLIELENKKQFQKEAKKWLKEFSKPTTTDRAVFTKNLVKRITWELRVKWEALTYEEYKQNKKRIEE